jgi:hypothetical protein
MSVGEGIFYGLVFLGIIYLYIQTKDRWNWKKIVFRFFGGIIVLVLIAVSLDYIFDNFSRNSFTDNQKPKIITGMNGIELGAKLSDVIFKTGAIKDKKQEDVYFSPSDVKKRFTIDKESKTVISIQHNCSSDDLSYPNTYSPKINGVMCGDSEFDIFMKYSKEKINVLCNKGGSGNLRKYEAVDFGVRYFLITNKVQVITIHYPDDLKKSSDDGWQKCD